jgi:hypothetical protein
MAIRNTPQRQKPLPRTRRENFDGTLRYSGKPAREKREEQIKRSDDTFKDVSVGLQDIDEAIIYYFKNIIKPRVLENGLLIDVPIKYGDPEMWVSSQKDGYLRDKKGKIIAPIVMYRRLSVARNDEIPIDKADRNLVHYFPKKWSNEHNKYDRFSITHNIKPTYEMYNIVVPDYVLITYECVIWTSFVTQMNRIVEAMQYAEGDYWGDDEKFKFQSKIDSFDMTTELSVDKGRMVRSTFTLEIRGFLVPEIANDLLTTQKEYTKQRIILETETEIDILSVVQPDPFCEKIIVSSTSQPAIGANQTITDLINAKILQLQLQVNYQNKLAVYSTFTTAGATVVSASGGNSIATYPNVYTASIPSDLPATSTMTATDEDDFLVFVNGQYMEHDAFVVQQSGSDFVVIANEGSLGYSLANEDEIVTWGKFS